MNGALAALLSFAVLTCGAEAGGDVAGTAVRVEVPTRLAEQAAARAAGKADVPPPILILEDVELGNEGLTIEVRAPGKPGAKEPGPLLGSASMVGSGERDESAPPERFTLVVPLAEEAWQLLADETEVTLVLRVKNAPERRLVLAHARFDDGKD